MYPRGRPRLVLPADWGTAVSATSAPLRVGNTLPRVAKIASGLVWRYGFPLLDGPCTRAHSGLSCELFSQRVPLLLLFFVPSPSLSLCFVLDPISGVV